MWKSGPRAAIKFHMSIIDDPVAQVVSIQEQLHDPLAELFDLFLFAWRDYAPLGKGDLGPERRHV